jgi:hypothetical protein
MIIPTIKSRSIWLLSWLVIFSTNTPSQADAREKSVAIIVVGDPGVREDVVQGVELLFKDLTSHVTGLPQADLMEETQDTSKLAEEVKQALSLMGKEQSNASQQRGYDAIQRHLFSAKSALEQVTPRTISMIYLGLALGQLRGGDNALALDYLTAARNIDEQLYNEVSTKHLELTGKLKTTQDAKNKIMLTIRPMGAHLVLDGEDMGVDPLEVEVTPGLHLAKLQAEGYQRMAWLLDSSTSSKTWTMTLSASQGEQLLIQAKQKVVDSFRTTEKEKKALLKGKGKAEVRPCPTQTMETLRRLHGSRAALAVLVSPLDDRILIRGCFQDQRGMGLLNMVEPRRSSLRERVRENLQKAYKQRGAAKSKPKLGPKELEELKLGVKQQQENFQSSINEITHKIRALEKAGCTAGLNQLLPIQAHLLAMVDDYTMARSRLAEDPAAIRSLLSSMEKAYKGTAKLRAKAAQVKPEDIVAAKDKAFALEYLRIARTHLAKIKLRAAQKGPSFKPLRLTHRALRKDLRRLSKAVKRRKYKAGMGEKAANLALRAVALEAEILALQEPAKAQQGPGGDHVN